MAASRLVPAGKSEMSGGDSSGEEAALQIDVGKPEVKKGKGEKAPVIPRRSPGDVVWAKVSGFNFWPGKVFDPTDDLIPDYLREPPKPGYDLVRFFGTYDIQWVSPRMIEGYEKGLVKKFHSKSRSKIFLKAVKEVKEFVESGVSPEGLTSRPPEPAEEKTDGSQGSGNEEASAAEEKPLAGSKRKGQGKSPAAKKAKQRSSNPKEREGSPPKEKTEAAEKQCDEATEDSGPVSEAKAEDGAKETKETAEDQDSS